MSKAPSIRVKNHVENWNEHRVCEIADINPHCAVPNTFEYVDLESVVGTEMVSHRTEHKETAPSRAQRLAKQGDLFYQTVRPYQKNNYLFELNQENYVFSTGYAQIRSNYDGHFLLGLLQSDAFVKNVLDICTGTGYPAINSTGLANIEFYSTDKIDEQRQIGRLLQSIDHLLSLHQRKLDTLLSVRKSMLQKMFPRNGSKVPEIRFNGFEGEWEQKPFDEIVTRYLDLVDTPHEGYYRLGIRSHAKGTFHSYVEKGQELETAQMSRVAANNFIVNITFGWEHAVAITNKDDEGKLVSHRFPQFSFNEGMVPAYFKYLIIDEKFKHHLWLSSPGGAGRNRVLKIDEMLQYKFWVPKEAEQQRISEFFNQLDMMINLQQQKVDALKNTKKALLAKMFV